jgi:NTE family protein
MPGRALVLSGGGAKGAFQLGAVDHLVNDRGLDFDVVAGVSVGALNAAVLAQAGPGGVRDGVDQLKRLWFGIRGNGDVYRKRLLGGVLVFLIADSLFDPGPLRRHIEREVDPDALRASGRRFRTGAVELESGRYVSVTEAHDRLRDWILGSASVPLAFPPVAIAGGHVVDGGVRNVTPLREAFAALKREAAGADEDEMYVLLASPLDVPPALEPSWGTGRHVGQRALEILANEVFREDLSYAVAINRSVRAYLETESLLRRCAAPESEAAAALRLFPYRPPDYRPVRLFVVEPSELFSTTLEFDPAIIRRAFEEGREAAAHPLDEATLAERLKSA